MTRKNLQTSTKALSSLAISSGILLAALDAQAAVSQSPLSLTIGVPPNLILTLDDSSSMDRAYVPDSIPGGSGTRRYNSANYNAMYYNPSVTYRIPPTFNSDGTPGTPLTTSFTAARRNGFNAARGTVNLSNSYRSTWTYTVTSSASSEGNNPTPEFYLSFDQTGVNLTAGATSGIYTRNGIDYRLTRASSGSGCSVNVVSPENYPTISCTRSSSTSTTYQLRITDRRTTGVPAYYYIYDKTLTSCTEASTDENCYRKIDVSNTSGTLRADAPEAGTDERQNFAIWYSFYRTRGLATVSAASIAFSELSSSTRLTWQGLTTCTALNSSSSCNSRDNRFREYSASQRGRLFDWMQNMAFPGNTPLRAALDRAGKFLQTDVAWHKYPNESGNSADNTYACRPSYHILMTDGVWNSSNGTPTNTLRADHSSFTLPDDTVYSGRRPYVDGTTNTLADLAMHYWATDLRSGTGGAANKLKPYLPYKSGNEVTDYWDARNNPATWQHMVNFTIGLGLSNSLKQPGLEWDNTQGALGGTAYNNLVSGARAWPAAAADSTNNVYDLWHAAINSRGDFFSADSPETVVQAFSDIMSRISERKSTASRPAMNSGQVTEDEVNGTSIKTVSYQTTYASDENWSGDLIRTEKEFSINPETDEEKNTQRTIWRASEQMPPPDSRNIYIADTLGSLQAFTWSNAGSPNTIGTLANYLNRNPENGNTLDNKGQARLNYLRGSRTGEDSDFRVRNSILGDLYSSTPVGVSKARYLINIADSIEGNTTYTTFANSVSNRKGMVYVGGNDGMLHGFNAQTGREEFAFIPTAVFPNLNKLTGKNYSHHFYVDGSPVVADIYDEGHWRTILVGTLRAGGKSIFALDITDPDNIRLLWEFDDNKIPGTDTVKMGYSFSKPTVARLDTGKWAVVFGNGYEAQNHTNGKAALFVLDAVSGNLLKSLEVQGEEDVANGLSTPKLSDYNADGIAEFAYAGDLQGNLWRFNLYANDASSFSVAYGGKPMISAVSSEGDRQHITSAPSLVRHPTGKGYLVIFGTGKYFEDGDKDGDKSMAQTLYGIWDPYTRLEIEDFSASSGEIPINRNRLVEQNITQQITAKNQANQDVNARVISDNAINWTVLTNGQPVIVNYGWRLDFKEEGVALDGEMVVDDMATLGRSLFLQTLVPNDDPCADGASNWTYAINPHSGGRLRHNALMLAAALPKDVFTSGQQQPGEGGLSVSQKPDGQFEVCTGTTCMDVIPDPASIGRQTWRLVEDIE